MNTTHTHTSVNIVRRRRSAWLLIAVMLLTAVSFNLSGRGKVSATGTGDIIYALTQSNRLLRFSVATPGTIDQIITVTGLQFGESLVGIDFRPATGQLFALGLTGGNVLRTYRIDLATGAATQVGNPSTASQSAGVAAGVDYGFDFNPTVDRIRVVADSRDNFRLNPDTGGIAGADTALTAGAVITGAAYDRNFVASPQPATTLYGIDANTDQLVTIGGINSTPSPNLGAVTPVGALGVNTSNLVGFDITNDASNNSFGTAYASLTTTATSSSLYRVNLATGAATLVGLIDTGANLPVVDIAIAPAGTVQLSLASYVVAESAGTATITVNRVGGDCGTITVNIATSDGTATAGADYTAVSTTLTFAPGVTSRTITIPIINDNIDELDETVNITLSANVGGRITAPATATLTIADDDLSAISINDVALAEGNAGTTNAVFTVSLSNSNVLPVTVNYTTADGTATGGVDYVAVTAPVTVTFPAGTTTQTIAVVINGDVEGEDNETFFVNLATAVNAAIADAQGRGVIVNDDIRLNVPGAPIPVDNSTVSDQKPGSLLIFPIYTSSAAAGNTTNTRFSITNVDAKVPVTVHLFQVDGSTCAVSDSYLCLTALQTATFLASDLDPGTTGYLVAVAVNADGCPIIFNGLIGDEYVKFPSGHAANLGAEAVAGLAGLATTPCGPNSTAVQLNFDGLMYQPLPRIVAVDNLASRGDGNDPLLIINRIGGSLITSAGTITSIFGIIYDDTENPASFGFTTSNCQFRSNISSAFPRTTPRLEQFIPAGRSGWMKLWGGGDIALLGAVINFNPNVSSSPSAFSQGHNLHKLTLTTSANVTIPVFPPAC